MICHFPEPRVSPPVGAVETSAKADRPALVEVVDDGCLEIGITPRHSGKSPSGLLDVIGFFGEQRQVGA